MSNKLRIYRLEAGLSQIDLAHAAEVPRFVVQMAENSLKEPDPLHRAALAKALGMSESTIFPKTKKRKHS